MFPFPPSIKEFRHKSDCWREIYRKVKVIGRNCFLSSFTVRLSHGKVATRCRRRFRGVTLKETQDENYAFISQMGIAILFEHRTQAIRVTFTDEPRCVKFLNDYQGVHATTLEGKALNVVIKETNVMNSEYLFLKKFQTCYQHDSLRNTVPNFSFKIQSILRLSTSIHFLKSYYSLQQNQSS